MDQGNLFENPASCPACGRIDGHTAGCPRDIARPEVAPGEYPATRDAIEQAEKHANSLWMETAYHVGVMHARMYQFFTSADIDLAMLRDFPNVATHEKRAMGAVIRRMIRERIIEKTPDMVPDPRANCHNQNKRVLRSLLYQPIRQAV